MLDFTVTFIITIINIVVLSFILRFLLFKPVTKFMAARSKRIQDSIDQAEKDKAASQKLHDQYKRQMKDASFEADEVVRAGRVKAEAEAKQIIADGRAAAEAYLAAARAQIEVERKAGFAQFKIEAAALVMAAAARLVQKEFSGEDNRRYANMLLDELASQKGVK